MFECFFDTLRGGFGGYGAFPHSQHFPSLTPQCSGDAPIARTIDLHLETPERSIAFRCPAAMRTADSWAHLERRCIHSN